MQPRTLTATILATACVVALIYAAYQSNVPAPVAAPPSGTDAANSEQARDPAQSAGIEPDAAMLRREPTPLPESATGLRVTCVWSHDGRPAARMPIGLFRIADDGRERAGSATTDVDGRAVFEDLSAGDYTVRIVRYSKPFAVPAGVMVEQRVELEQAAHVVGTVVDAAEAPVAEAEIYTTFGGHAYAIATSGADGGFAIQLPTRAPIWANHPRYRPSELHAIEGDAVDLVLQLDDGAALRGIVIAPNGAPVPGAQVTIATAHGQSQRPKFAPLQLLCDATGRFATEQSPPGPVIVYADFEGFAFGTAKAEAGADTQVIVPLRDAASVFGTLLGGAAGEEPLAGVEMLIHRPRDLAGLTTGMSDRWTRRSTVTDTAGRYRIDGIPPGRMWLVAMLRKPVHHSMRLEAGDEHEWNPDLRPPACVIRGRLEAPDGNPLAGWIVRATRLDLIEMAWQREQATTAADGTFEVHGLRDAPHKLTAIADGDEIAIRDEVLPDRAPLVWRMPGLPSQAGTITGVVVDADGRSLDEVSIVASQGAVRRRVAPGNGQYRIHGALPGDWQLLGKLKGYGSFAIGSATVTPNATIDVGTHRLAPRGTATVQIAAAAAPQGLEIRAEQLEGGDNAAKLTKDGEVYRTPPLPPGRYRMTATGSNTLLATRDVEIPAGEEQIVEWRLQVTEPTTIEFVPEDPDGEARDFVTFTLRDASGNAALERTIRSAGESAVIQLGLAPGGYSLQALSAGNVYRRGATQFVVPANQPEAPRAVRLPLRIQTR